eukprot:7288031-Pyramimonas_sp.AAC.1
MLRVLVPLAICAMLSLSAASHLGIVTRDVAYTEGGAELLGYQAYNDAIYLDVIGIMPIVVIVPAWDGIHNDVYEKERAVMLAELGYFAFVADIYGIGTLSDTAGPQEFMGQASLYFGDTDLFVRRITAAIDKAKLHLLSDSLKVVAIGYCFGGTGTFTVPFPLFSLKKPNSSHRMRFPETCPLFASSGVLNLAISGADVLGVVSFHGGLTNGRMKATDAIKGPGETKILVLSGGDDDVHSDVKDLEDELTEVNAIWEITRFGDVMHSFTDWDAHSPSTGNAYNERADMRSWDAMNLFLTEVFHGMSPETYINTVDSVDLGSTQRFPSHPNVLTSVHHPSLC